MLRCARLMEAEPRFIGCQRLPISNPITLIDPFGSAIIQIFLFYL